MKTDLIGARDEQAIKERFEAAARARGETPSEALRRLVRLYIKKGGKV